MSQKSLPHGWARVKLGDVLLSVIGGGTPSRKNPAYFNGRIPWFTVKDMHSLRPNDAQEHISERAVKESATNIIPANTLIIATRIALGKAIKPTVACAINQDLKALITPTGISSDFLLYWIIANARRIQELGSGTTVSGIRLEVLNNLEIDLPPSSEQARIVEKIEEIFSDLDAGMAELTFAQKKFIQYRQSLLKSAVEGQLTATWRAENEPQETGEQLLARILLERRRHWEEEQLTKFREQDKIPPEDWKDRYSEPVSPDTTVLPELPAGWVWATINQLSLDIKYGSSSKTTEDKTGVPVLRMGNIQHGELDFENLKYLPPNHEEFPNLLLADGDMLFNRTNSAELVGKTAVYRSQIAPCSYASYLIAVRFSSMFVPEIASAFINSVHGKSWIRSVVTQQTGQANVNGTKLAALAVPLAPICEQREIKRNLVLEIDRLNEQVIATKVALCQSEAQRKNILKSAFCGKLIPQDIKDELAGVLLERIRTEKEEHAKRPKPLRENKELNEVTAIMETLIKVLETEKDWIAADQAFRRCGVTDGTRTDHIEKLYEELRQLDKNGHLEVRRIGDFDEIRLKERA